MSQVQESKGGQENQEVKFYEKTDPYYEFSNFYPSPIFIEGKMFPTVEHFYQAMKYSSPPLSPSPHLVVEDKEKDEKREEYFELIRTAKTPSTAFYLGKQQTHEKYPWQRELATLTLKYKKVQIRYDWEEVKEEIMYQGLQQKFTYPTLKKLLLDTGDKILIENSPRDGYWGVGSDGKGKNRLGILLMKLRFELSYAK